MPRFVAPDGVTTIPVSAADPLPVTFAGGSGPGEQVEVTALPSTGRASSVTRVATATTTSITAGARAYSVTVVAAASSASPTLDGVALPLGMTVRVEADGANTLDAASVVTVSGDDVIIVEVR